MQPVEDTSATGPESIYGYGALPPMAVPAVLLYGDKRLREVCEPVAEKEFGADKYSMLRRGAQMLAAALHRHDGAAIAAPQVGVLQRMVVVAGHVAGHDYPIALINPEITDQSEERVIEIEGCLSFPKIFARVERPIHVTVRAWNPSGEPFEITAHAVFARTLCHELEHLDGVLLLDHTSGLKRQLITTKMAKFRRRLDHANKRDAPKRRK